MTTTNERTGSLGFEDKLWNAADVLRNNMQSGRGKSANNFQVMPINTGRKVTQLCLWMHI